MSIFILVIVAQQLMSQIDEDIKIRENMLNDIFWELCKDRFEGHVEKILVLFTEIRQLEREKYHFESNRSIFDKVNENGQ